MRRPTPPAPDLELVAALRGVLAAVVELGFRLYAWPAWEPDRVGRVREAAEGLPAEERAVVLDALDRAGRAVEAGDHDEAVGVMFDLRDWLEDLTGHPRAG